METRLNTPEPEEREGSSVHDPLPSEHEAAPDMARAGENDAATPPSAPLGAEQGRETEEDNAIPSLPALPRVRLSVAPHHLILAAILAIGAALRYFGLDWDRWSGLHPDERFVATGVVQRLALPSSWSQFLTPAGPNGPISPLEPANFNYGSLPMYLYWIVGHVAAWLGGWVPGLANWQDALGSGVYATGRFVSATAGVLTILLVYLIGQRVYGRAIGLLGAALFALCVLDIQLSHFLTVDPLTTFFATLAIYYCVRIAQERRPADIVWAGVWTGAAMACKASALVLVVPLIVAPFLPGTTTDKHDLTHSEKSLIVWRQLGWLVIAAIAAIALFFATQPYALIDWHKYLSDVQYQTDLASGKQHIFYTDKFYRTPPFWYHIEHIVPWDLGWPLGLAAMAGVITALWRSFSRRRTAGEIVVVGWTLLYFLATGGQFMKYLRYMLPIMPELCLLAAAALVPALLFAGQTLALRRIPRLQQGLVLGVLVLTALYALAYDNIYTTLNTRLQASVWIEHHIPAGTPYTTEAPWDEGLPWSFDTHIPPPGAYNSMTLATVSGGDTLQAWTGGITESVPAPSSLTSNLARAQYVTISSERIMGTVPHLSEAFPFARRYYRLLFDMGRDGVDPLGFRLAASFTNHPHLFGLSLDDYVADQNFSEYDHPPVWIFQRVRTVDSLRTAALITDNWRVHDVPALATPDKPLLLTPQEVAANNKGPSYAQEFSSAGLPMQAPALVWLLWLEALGLLALPLTLRLFRRLPDRSVILAKTLGLLLTAYLSWLAASLHLLPFARTTMLLAAILTGICSLLWGLPLREAARFLRIRWRAVALAEGVFLAGFIADVIVRMIYPDLWHAWNGGEKPMDFSYLNGVVRSQTMPPADPWFAGGYINYYYYGYVAVATMIKLTGIAPSVAYNLAVPTLFALTLAGAYTVGYALTRRHGIGLLAAALTGIAGNLYVGVQVVATLIAISPVQATFPLLGGVIGIIGGLWQVFTQQLLLHHQVFPAISFRMAYGWGWDSTRVIDSGNTINEFPFFTFLYADLHAHMMDLPVMLACVALGANAALGAWPWRPDPDRGDGRSLVPGSSAVVLLITAIVAGAAGPTNSWDLPTALLLIALGTGLNLYTRRARLWPALLLAGLTALGLGLLAYGLYYPFYGHLKSFYAQIGFTLAHTRLDQFLTFWGLFLFIIASYLARDLWQGPAGVWLRRQWRALLFTLYYWPRRDRVLRLFHAIVPRYPTAVPPYNLIALAAGLVLALAMVGVGAPVLALLLLLLGTALTALLEPRAERDNARNFVLLLATLALAITAACEFAYLVDFEAGSAAYRMNTVFKLYEQAWVLFAVASAAALPALARLPRLALPASAPRPAMALGIVAHPPRPLVEPAPSTTPAPERAQEQGWQKAWLIVLGFLLVAVSLYPIVETPLHLAERPTSNYWQAAGNPQLGPTLDGTRFVQRAFPGEYAALTWLNSHVRGDPTVLSSNQGGYSSFAFRVPWMTGLPTLVEWDGEQAQQRYSGQTDTAHWPYAPYPDEVKQRDTDLTAIYTTTDIAQALQLLRRYHVRYIYVGLAERGEQGSNPSTGCFAFGSPNIPPGGASCMGYPPAGLAKFDTMVARGMLTLPYNHEGVKIYEVRT